LNVLNDLKIIHKYLIDLLERCPVTIAYHSTGVINKKILLEKRMDEVEKHLEIFNKKKVFLKNE